MHEHRFDPKHLEKLNNPGRLKDIPPEVIWSRLGIEKADVVVDLGAGTAFFSTAFSGLAHPSILYACDVSDVMISWVKENVVPRHPEIIPVKTGDAEIPLDNDIADLLFMINLHHELDGPEKTLKECFRILKPGGVIFIADWKKEEMSQGPPVEIRCEPDSVKQQLETAGFTNIQIHTDLPKHFLIVAGVPL